MDSARRLDDHRRMRSPRARPTANRLLLLAFALPLHGGTAEPPRNQAGLWYTTWWTADDAQREILIPRGALPRFRPP